jgi:hypothetical protein
MSTTPDPVVPDPLIPNSATPRTQPVPPPRRSQPRGGISKLTHVATYPPLVALGLGVMAFEGLRHRLNRGRVKAKS